MKEYRVVVREVVKAEYIVAATDADAARSAVEMPKTPLRDRRELETVDWEVESVEQLPTANDVLGILR